jgi:hypothetical protein
MAGGAVLALPLPSMLLSVTTPPAGAAHPVTLPVTVDRVAQIWAPVLCAFNPLSALLAIVGFRTMMLTGVPGVSAKIPFAPSFAITLSVTVALMVWVGVTPSNNPRARVRATRRSIGYATLIRTQRLKGARPIAVEALSKRDICSVSDNNRSGTTIKVSSIAIEQYVR